MVPYSDNIFDPIQQQSDSIHAKDSSRIALIKLVPSEHISNTDGAIIPKEAVQMTKLVPAIHEHKEPETQPNYFLVGSLMLAALLLIILALFLFKKRSETEE